MTDVRTQHVIDALTELGFERRMANGSHALYAHPAGAGVSVPHGQPCLSGALLKAIERQVTGFGIASACAFAEKVHAIHSPDADTSGAGRTEAEAMLDDTTPAPRDSIEADETRHTDEHMLPRHRVSAK